MPSLVGRMWKAKEKDGSLPELMTTLTGWSTDDGIFNTSNHVKTPAKDDVSQRIFSPTSK